MTDALAKDIEQILDDKRETDAAKPDAPPAPAPEADAAADGDNRPTAWTYAALQDERQKRKTYQHRVGELEEENKYLRLSQEQASAPQPGPTDDFWTNPDATLNGWRASLNLRASQAEAIATHGRESYDALQSAVAEAMQRGHPDLPVLREAMLASDDPVGVAMNWWQSQGGQQSPSRGSMFPSNLAGARNVGRRAGPGWNGPTPLDDIFDRQRR